MMNTVRGFYENQVNDFLTVKGEEAPHGDHVVLITNDRYNLPRVYTYLSMNEVKALRDMLNSCLELSEASPTEG